MKDEGLTVYLPECDEERLPPRNYFFQVLATIRPDWFKDLLKTVESERKSKQMEEEELIKVQPEIWKELEGVKLETVFISAPSSKRVVKTSKRRLKK